MSYGRIDIYYRKEYDLIEIETVAEIDTNIDTVNFKIKWEKKRTKTKTGRIRFL